MAVLTFTLPTSLDGSLAASNLTMTLSKDEERSVDAAKRTEQSFSSHAQAPLASHTNPNSKPGITFAHQDKLPKLPIPDLDSSLNKYLSALEPLQSAKEHRDTISAVQDFLKSEGPELQERLKKYATGKTNYIEQFC
jgi:carnitine O-acetyltransferase